MNWNKMVKMTVPVGLCGWQQRGSLTINGRTTEFPVGVETELPEPVAERVKALMADAEEKAEHVQPLKPWMQYVTGADGVARWEPRLAYAETEEVVILPETTIPINYDENLVQGQFAEPLSEGNEYTVNYNGTAYMCVAQPFDRGDGVKNIALGNIGALVGGDDTGEPFALIAFPPAMAIEFSASLITFDGAETVTISITAVEETIKPIDPKYLPSGSGGGGGVIYVPNLTPDPSVINYCYKDNAGTSMLDFATGHEMMINGALLCYPSEETGNNYFHPGVFQVIPDANGIAAGIFIPETETFSMVMLGFSDTNA